MTLHTEKQRSQFRDSLRELPDRTHGNTKYRYSKGVMGVLSSAYVKNEVDKQLLCVHSVCG